MLGVSGTNSWPPFAAIIATLLRRFQKRLAACNPNPSDAPSPKASPRLLPTPELHKAISDNVLKAFLSVPWLPENRNNPADLARAPLTVQEFASLLHSAAVISESKRLARELIARAAKASSPSSRYDPENNPSLTPEDLAFQARHRKALEQISPGDDTRTRRKNSRIPVSRVEAKRIDEKAIAKAAR